METQMKRQPKKLTKANRLLYLNFITSSEVKDLLTKIPKSAQCQFLRNQFKEKTGVEISDTTQNRIKEALDSGDLIEVNGSFFMKCK
jgi:hypothetical protein